MAAVRCLLSEEQLLCSICLQVLSEPVSIPCGHNFCKACLTQEWDKRGPCQCPQCSKTFNTRPELHVNMLVSAIISQLKSQSPPENLKNTTCPEHDQPLEFFCCTDNTCVCMICSAQEHKYHDVVALKEEYEKQKASLPQVETETQQMVDEKQLQIQDIQHAVELSQQSADEEIAGDIGLQTFTALIQAVQENQDQFLKRIQEKQKLIKQQAQNLVQELEQEISELQKRSTQLELLSCAEDHLHFLQRSTSLKPPLASRERRTSSFKPDSFEGTAARALSALQDTLNEQFNKVFKAELKRVQQFAVNITLDQDTAPPKLTVSRNKKEVYCVDLKNTFLECGGWVSDQFNVLGSQGFSSGRFYFEVQVKGKSDWDVGVANESINRKNKVTFVPPNGYWSIYLRNGDEYNALTDPSVRLSLKSAPQKVGVFVDFDRGLVAFHDVDTAALIFTFTDCCFKGKVLPYLSPGLAFRDINFRPLIITDKIGL